MLFDNLSRLFQQVPEISAARLREYMQERPPESYALVDVRQPEEYRRGHLPGARLMPLPELPDRLGELDRNKPVITY